MNNLVWDIVKAVIGSTVFFLLGYSINRIKHKIKMRSYRKLWKPMMREKRALIVFSTRSFKLPWNTARISFTEAEAYEEVHLLCRQLGIKLEIERSNVPLEEKIMQKLKSHNLIILGSPAANLICEEIWNKLKQDTKHPFEFFIEKPSEKFTKRDGSEITVDEMNKQYFKLGKEEYLPELDKNVPYEDKRWVTDYGVIVRYSNPFNKEKEIILAMGCHGFSTYGAMSMMTNINNAKELLDKTQNKNFMALVKFGLTGNKIISKTILHNFDITSKVLSSYLNQ